MPRPATLLLCLVLSSCASGPYPVTSPYYQIPAGSHLVLNQSLEIAPNMGRVYIQYGKVSGNKPTDQYYPHCWFVSWTISDKKTLIKPGKFTITASRQEEDYVSINQNPMFAALNMSSMSHSSYGATAIEYSTVLTIHSETQKNIREFVCSHWEDPTDAVHLTVAQINQALGKIARLELP